VRTPGAGTICDHHLKSSGGCDGYANSHHFGGMEHRYNPDSTLPGTGSNTDIGDLGGGGGGGLGTGTCPRIDQYVLVEAPDGSRAAKMACLLKKTHRLFNPLTGRFHDIKLVRIVRDQPIWILLAGNGALGFSSFSHPVFPHAEHKTGLPAAGFVREDPILTFIFGELAPSGVVLTQDTGEVGDVVQIEMKDGHVYCAGDSPQKMHVCHNVKPQDWNTY
jgi:hypothetical protein